IKQQIESNSLQKQVQLLGSIPFAQMSAYFESHQLFVMPSFYEPFGIVYIEAMGAGLPIIASTAGAGRELIQHEENGFLVQAGSSADISNAIRQVASDRLKLAEMGQRARVRYEQHPTWAETGKTITTFLESLI
ncbi:MAG: glycosyltransferase family 4 protein, partial [Anaerolineae bacterium]